MVFRRYFTWPERLFAATTFLALVVTLLPYPPRIPVADSAIHFLLAFSVAMVASTVTRRPKFSAAAAFSLLTVAEVLQNLIPGRDFSLGDIMWNATGALITVPIIIGVAHMRRRSLAI